MKDKQPSPSLFDTIKNSETIGVFIYQEHGKIAYANKHFANILGYDTPNELIGKDIIGFCDYGKERLAQLKDIIDRRTKGESLPFEVTSFLFKSKDKITVYADVLAYTTVFKGSYSGLALVVDRSYEHAYKRLFYALSQINQLIVREDHKESVLEKICNLLVKDVGYLGATIGHVDGSMLFKADYVSSKIKELEETLKTVKIGVNPDTPFGTGSISKAYHSGRVSVVSDVLQNAEMSNWNSYYKAFNIRSVCSIPIFQNSKLAYIILIVDNNRISFNRSELELLNEIKLDISFALDKIERQKIMLLLQEAIDKSHECAVITDINANILYTNKAVSDISGYTQDELIGKNTNLLKSGYHDARFYQELWSKLLDKKIVSTQFVNKARNGTLFNLDSIIIPIIVDDKIYRFVQLSRDVTELVNKEKQLKFTSKIYNTLYHMSKLLIKSKGKDEFLAALPNLFVNYMDMSVAFVAKREKNRILKIEYSSYATDKGGKFLNFVQTALPALEKNPLPNRLPLQITIEDGRIHYIDDISAADKDYGIFAEYAKLYNINSCSAIPIKTYGKTINILVLLSHKRKGLSNSIKKLLEMAAYEIEFALNRFKEARFSKMILSTIDSGFDSVVIVDSEFNIKYVNRKAEIVFGYTKEEMIGRNHSLLSSHTHSKEFVKNFYATLKEGKVFSGIINYKVKSGNTKRLFVNIFPFNKHGATNYIAIGQEIKDKDVLSKQLDRILYYDEITDFPNIRAFRGDIKRFISRAATDKVIGAVIILNPLSFKSINNAFGFKGGNKLLKLIAERIKSCLKSYDVVAKLESDLFGVLLKNMSNELDAMVVAAKLLNDISGSYQLEGKIAPLSFNIGLSMYPRDGKNADELIEKARTALTDAKEKGTNAIGFFRKDLEIRASERLKLKTDLDVAAAKGEFIAYYQPYVNSKLEIAGAESLIRWVKDDKIITPNKFIPYLETTEQIISVESRMIDNVLKEIGKIKSFGINPIPISVNLSDMSLRQDDLYSDILSKININNLPANLLRIEIVERSFIKHFQSMKILINRLKNNGVQFYIDDFGTGFSSLSYIANLPVSCIKIDISFVRKITDDSRTANIVRSIIFLAHALDMHTIAEGVETEAQFKLLKSMHCDYFQGYLFYKPMPQDKFEKELKKF